MRHAIRQRPIDLPINILLCLRPPAVKNTSNLQTETFCGMLIIRGKNYKGENP